MKQIKRIFSVLNRALTAFENYTIGFALLVATILVTANVIARFIFKHTFVWSDELVRNLLIFVTYIGCGGCIRRGDHIAIDMVQSFLKNEKAKRVMQILVSLLCICFSAAITYSTWQLTVSAAQFPQLTVGMRIPQFYLYVMLPIGFGIATIRYIQQLVGCIIGVDFFAADKPPVYGKDLDVDEQEGAEI